MSWKYNLNGKLMGLQLCVYMCVCGFSFVMSYFSFFLWLIFLRYTNSFFLRRSTGEGQRGEKSNKQNDERVRGREWERKWEREREWENYWWFFFFLLLPLRNFLHFHFIFRVSFFFLFFFFLLPIKLYYVISFFFHFFSFFFFGYMIDYLEIRCWI